MLILSNEFALEHMYLHNLSQDYRFRNGPIGIQQLVLLVCIALLK